MSLIRRFQKSVSSRFSTDWSTRDIIITFFRLLLYLCRGTFQRVFFGSSKGLVLVGHGASIRYAGHLYAGKDFIVEDFAEVNCLSLQNIIIGDRVTIGKFALIRPGNSYGGDIGEGLKIGNNSNVGPYSYIGCSGYIEIGNNVMMGPRVGIYAENHNFDNPELPIKDQGVKRQFVKINDDCWIAANSIILAGVTIGEGCVIAAGSVVTKDIPPFSVVAGSPAVVIKSRK